MFSCKTATLCLDLLTYDSEMISHDDQTIKTAVKSHKHIQTFLQENTAHKHFRILLLPLVTFMLLSACTDIFTPNR